MISILGSGFGLYGYLPALIGGCAQRIVLPERYRACFFERPELERFIGNVQWVPNENVALDSADGVVIALRPINQSEWIFRCLTRSNIERLLLEKPLAHSPEVAEKVFDSLVRSRKVFRIGYTFRYTAWGKQILKILGSKRESGLFIIHWSFLAHHFRHKLHNWKRFNTAGGGAIRFYGIHIIALLAEIGYCDVTVSLTFGASSDEIEKWTAIFVGTSLPECEVVVDTKSTKGEFRVEHVSNSNGVLENTVFANLSDPFELRGDVYELGKDDRRVPILSQLCCSLWEEDENEYEWYHAAIKLWLSVESKTQFQYVL
jgi:hypothetical protein